VLENAGAALASPPPYAGANEPVERIEI